MVFDPKDQCDCEEGMGISRSLQGGRLDAFAGAPEGLVLERRGVVGLQFCQ